MKKYFLDILKKIRILFSKRNHASYMRDPERDWLHILSYATMLCLAVVAVDGYIFYKLNRGELFNATPTVKSAILTLNRPLLEQELKFYGHTVATSTPSVATSSTTSATSTSIKQVKSN